ncbi:hypothetical protein CEXT_474901 [Caerostris extrusa]|uniref:Uncharacterized protein n=1 Tax=Caerostris extrusa TaxID=172846 RepID=A0AAV4MYF0_CAEEX|nr:hypothetical protein CEXT_474901 [Caerostris extrusa]
MPNNCCDSDLWFCLMMLPYNQPAGVIVKELLRLLMGWAKDCGKGLIHSGVTTLDHAGLEVESAGDISLREND